MRRSAARQKSYSLPRRRSAVYYTLTHAPSPTIIEIILIRITIFIHNIKLWLCNDSLVVVARPPYRPIEKFNGLSSLLLFSSPPPPPSFRARLARWCAQVARQRRAPTISAVVATPFAGVGRRTLRHPLLNTIYVYALCYYTAAISDYTVYHIIYTLLTDKRYWYPKTASPPCTNTHTACMFFL